MARDSEFRAYHHIVQCLKDLGWNTNNPYAGGDVYEQGELKHDGLLKKALGRERPEYTIRIGADNGFRYWIIEAKAEHSDLEKASKEAKDYADKINAVSRDTAKFATGVAGTRDDSFLVSTYYWDGNNWKEVEINSFKTTGFLSPQQCANILKENNPNIDKFDDDPDRFLKKANAINKALHENGIAVGDRAKVMGALLLALADEVNVTIHKEPTAMVREVNNRIEDILVRHKKKVFFTTIRLTAPATRKNHKLFRQAIVETIQHLREMNVRSAINGGDDALGKFYETFLKYANGAKEMGIVLTPRHITKFAVNALRVSTHDKVFDPACGTGGFLVAAMDYVRKKEGGGSTFNEFKRDGIFGVEKEDPVYGLALVNMIFRGDGKSGIEDGNCFDHDFWHHNGKTLHLMKGDRIPDGAVRPFSRVFMNPPFKIEKAPESEFVNCALKQMRKGGLLFAVLPEVVISGQDYASWRQSLLREHTIKAVVKFDKNLFYPIQEGTHGLVIESHRPHVLDKKVFFALLFDDNHRPRLSKMISQHEAVDNVEAMTDDLQNFLLDKTTSAENKPQEMILSAINPDGCDFSPCAYIDSVKPSKAPNMMDRSVSFVATQAKLSLMKQSQTKREVKLSPISLRRLIDHQAEPPIKALKGLSSGTIPVVSATAKENGIAGWKTVADSDILNGYISISKTHNTMPCQAFWHPYDFTAINTVHLVKPIAEFANNTHAVLYLCSSITESNAWRYDYARTVRLEELEVFLPLRDDGSIDYETIEAESRRQIGVIVK